MNPTNTTEQQNRIASLKRQIREVTGQDPILHPGTPGRSLPLDMEEQFLRRILEFESAAKSRPIDHLKKAGIPVTEPGELEDGAVHSALWEVLQGLADGQAVVTEGLQKLRPGAPITIRGAGPATTPKP